MTTQPKALELARDLDELFGYGFKATSRAATELRRLHAVNAELLKAVKACHMDLHYCAAQLNSEGWTTGSTVQSALDMARAAIAKGKQRQKLQQQNQRRLLKSR